MTKISTEKLKTIEKPKFKKNNKKAVSKQERRFFWIGMVFALPWIIGFLCFQLYPICSALYYSFTNYNLFQKPTFVGLENYITLFKDPKFSLSLGNTAYMAFLGLPLGLFVALMIALLLNMKIKGMPFFRTIYYLPTVVPMVASAMLFIWVLNPEYGLINNFLKLFGVYPGPSWLSDPRYTKMSLILMDTWRCGQSAIIFLAALKAVPEAFYEAAEIDGAGDFRKFWNITLPSISPTIQFLTIMGLIQSFQYFTQGYVFASITGAQQITGGPRDSLLFYSLYLYQQGFSYLKMGYACAMAIILFIVVMSITVVVFKIMDKRVSYDME